MTRTAGLGERIRALNSKARPFSQNSLRHLLSMRMAQRETCVSSGHNNVSAIK